MGKKGGDAQTLRDYWSGHGHAGPSHGAERDAIRWGEPGDFDRCVAQVTEHGKMTPEQAKGYCNLRHHDALGYYPATHARMEKGVNLLTKAADGSDEARVPPGKTTAGQFTVSGDGPSKAPKKPNPFAGGKKKTGPGKTGPKGKTGAKPKPKTGGAKGKRAALRQKIAGLRSQLSDLQKQEASLKSKLPKAGAASAATGTGSARTSAPQTTSQTSTPSKTGTSSTSQTSVSAQLAQVQAKIKQVKQQIKAAQAQLTATKSVEAATVKSSRNVRDSPTGRFRTFEGESQEAGTAFREGRMHDAVDLLGSARVLAQDPRHRTVLDQMQRSLSRTQHIVPTITKVGPHGYVHGWIKADEVTHMPAASTPRKGDTVVHNGRIAFHDGAAGKGKIQIRDPHGNTDTVPKSEVRAASGRENTRLMESVPGSLARQTMDERIRAGQQADSDALADEDLYDEEDDSMGYDEDIDDTRGPNQNPLPASPDVAGIASFLNNRYGLTPDRRNVQQ